MVEKISITTFAILLVIVILVSVVGTAFALLSLGLVSVGEATGTGQVTVNIVVPANSTVTEGEVGATVIGGNTGT